MTTLKQLQNEVKKRNNELDGLSDELVTSMIKYQNEYEKLLLKTAFNLTEDGNLKPTQGNYLKAQTLNPSKKLRFNDIAVNWVGEYPQVAKEQILFNKSIGVATDLQFQDLSAVKAFQQIDLDAMLTASRGMDAMIKKELVNHIALGAMYSEAVDNIALGFLGAGDKTGRIANWADSVMRTSMFGLTRTIDQEIYDDIGEEKFVYVGTLDNRTRDFCMARVGKEFTKDEINKFGEKNGSGLPGFFSPGGYRCRHSMIGVSTVA
jgi:hypothetical protein